MLSISSSAVSSEFGNVFTPPPAEQKSREASALVLEALEMLIRALRQREIGAPTDDDFQKAAGMLSEGAKMMEAVQNDLGGEEASRPLSAAQLQALAQFAFAGSEVTTVGDLYRKFQSETSALATQVGSLKVAPDQSVYPQISENLARYFFLAGEVTKAGLDTHKTPGCTDFPC